ncbi:MAG: polyprenol monophosphomannose synthase [Pirellulaceae bacterium]|nr:polyprenol monophosphomannose synthase [Pirellulaceae bacterium]
MFHKATLTTAKRRSPALITLATYNEIENLPNLVTEIQKALPLADILVIDDNSPDGTGTWCQEKSVENPRFHTIIRSGKLGLGSAVVAAMNYAIENDYEYLVNLDADFSHDPEIIPKMLSLLEADQADLVIGSRYVEGGQVSGWSWHRKVISRGVNILARWLLSLKPFDCSGSFRAYRVSSLKKLSFGEIYSGGYSFFEEVLWLLSQQKVVIKEEPIHFRDRTKGKSKINLREAIVALAVLLRLGVKNYVRI